MRAVKRISLGRQLSDEEHAEVVAQQDAASVRIPGKGKLRFEGRRFNPPKGEEDDWAAIVSALVERDYLPYINQDAALGALKIKGLHCASCGSSSFFVSREQTSTSSLGTIRYVCAYKCGVAILRALGIERPLNQDAGKVSVLDETPGTTTSLHTKLSESAESAESAGQTGGTSADTVPKVPNWEGFGFLSGRELDDLELPETTYLVDNLIPVGITLLVGPPKSCKTFAAIAVGVAVADVRDDVFGTFRDAFADSTPLSPANSALSGVSAQTPRFEVLDSGPVLFLSPDDPNLGRIRRRVHDISGTTEVPDDLHISGRQDIGVGATFADRLIDDLNERADFDNPAKLVVIDTLQRIKTPGGGADRYADDVAALRQLRRVCVAHPDVAILILHHSRKADPKRDTDPLELVSGSQGIAGGVDQVLILQVPSDRGPARTLHVMGRDGQDAKYALTMTERGLVLVDENPDDPARLLSAGSADVLRALRDFPSGVSAGELAEVLGQSKTSVADRLRRLVDSGHAIRVERGTYRASEWTGETD